MNGLATLAGKMGSAYRILVETPEEKGPLERHRHDREYNNKKDLKVYICESMG
jgi:hypothetical protein